MDTNNQNSNWRETEEGWEKIDSTVKGNANYFQKPIPAAQPMKSKVIRVRLTKLAKEILKRYQEQ